eukprot:TRINITY_DN7631_c0_g1_i1.p1 TRINITY_DN7631_c0_g1~~TRINITY_DN7631_c0_g1_i1.p1  ORF type:complete len:456 (-),score=87.21 TRINITY_DN7631_c0_g1_i1:21-1388(-)
MVWLFTVKGGPDATVVGTAHPYGGYNTHARTDWGKWCEKWLKRRVIAITLYTLVAIVAFTLSPVLLLGLYIADLIRIKRLKKENEHVDRDVLTAGSHLTYTRTGLFFLSYLFAEMCGVWVFGLGDYLLHNALWLVQYAFAKDAQTLHNTTQDRWLRWVYTAQYWWGARLLCNQCFLALGLEYTLDGKEEIEQDRPYILLMRHSSTADVLMPQFMFSEAFRMRYVVKKEILWDPGLDVMGNRSPNLFLSRSARDADMDAELQSMKNLVADYTPQSNIITSIWPEGTRFDAKKRRQILERLESNAEKERNTAAAERERPVVGKGKEKAQDVTVSAEEMYQRAQALQHTLLPRTGGVLALLEENEAKGHADVIICGHVGLEKLANFWDFASGKLGHVTVHVKLWRIPYADIPKDTVGRTRWLYDNWQIVDNWLATQHPSTPQPQQQSQSQSKHKTKTQ